MRGPEEVDILSARGATEPGWTCDAQENVLDRLVVAVAMLGFTVGARVVVADPSTNPRFAVSCCSSATPTSPLGATSIDRALTWQAHKRQWIRADHGISGRLHHSHARLPGRKPAARPPTIGRRSRRDLPENPPRRHREQSGHQRYECSGYHYLAGLRHYGHKIDWFMSLVPRTTPVLWTNLPCAIEPPNRLSAAGS